VTIDDIVREILVTCIRLLRADSALLADVSALIAAGASTSSAPHAEREYDTLSQFAARLGVSRRHVADLRAAGKLITVGAGMALRVEARTSIERMRRGDAQARGVVELDARRRARVAATRAMQRRDQPK
jgi:hypothetical protein